VSQTLFAAALAAPLIGVRKRWPDIHHAIDLDAVCEGWDRGTYRSACGLTGLRMVGAYPQGYEGVHAVQWPPRVSAMPDGVQRCRECWVATGKARPVSAWTRSTQ
jgi:hypothetical protein